MRLAGRVPNGSVPRPTSVISAYYSPTSRTHCIVPLLGLRAVGSGSGSACTAATTCSALRFTSGITRHSSTSAIKQPARTEDVKEGTLSASLTALIDAAKGCKEDHDAALQILQQGNELLASINTATAALPQALKSSQSGNVMALMPALRSLLASAATTAMRTFISEDAAKIHSVYKRLSKTIGINSDLMHEYVLTLLRNESVLAAVNVCGREAAIPVRTALAVAVTARKTSNNSLKTKADALFRSIPHSNFVYDVTPDAALLAEAAELFLPAPSSPLPSANVEQFLQFFQQNATNSATNVTPEGNTAECSEAAGAVEAGDAKTLGFLSDLCYGALLKRQQNCAFNTQNGTKTPQLAQQSTQVVDYGACGLIIAERLLAQPPSAASVRAICLCISNFSAGKHRRESFRLLQTLNKYIAQQVMHAANASEGVEGGERAGLARDTARNWSLATLHVSQAHEAANNSSAALRMLTTTVNAAHDVAKLLSVVAGRVIKPAEVLQDDNIVCALRSVFRTFVPAAKALHSTLLRAAYNTHPQKTATPDAPTHNAKPRLAMPVKDVVLRGGVRLHDVLKRQTARRAGSEVPLISSPRNNTLAAASTTPLLSHSDAGAGSDGASGAATTDEDAVERLEKETSEAWLSALDEIVSLPQDANSSIASAYDEAVRVSVMSGSTYAITNTIRSLAKANVKMSTRGLAYIVSARERARHVHAVNALRGTFGGGHIIMDGNADAGAPISDAGEQSDGPAPIQQQPVVQEESNAKQLMPHIPFTPEQWTTLLNGALALTDTATVVTPSAPPHPDLSAYFASTDHRGIAVSAKALSDVVSGSAAESNSLPYLVHQHGSAKVAQVVSGRSATLIAVYCETGRMDQAFKAFDTFVSAMGMLNRVAHVPEEDKRKSYSLVCSALAKGCAYANAPNASLKALEIAKTYNAILAPAVHAIVIEALCKAGSLDAAESLLRQCLKDGIHLPFYAHLALVNSLADSSQPALAFSALRLAQQSGELRSADDNAYRGIFNLSGFRPSALSMMLFDGFKALKRAVASGGIPAPRTVRIYHNPADRLHIRGILQSLNPSVEARTWGAGHRHRHLLVESETLANYFTAAEEHDDSNAPRASNNTSRGSAFGSSAMFDAEEASPRDQQSRLQAAYFKHTMVPRLSSLSSPDKDAAASTSTAAQSSNTDVAADEFGAWHSKWSLNRARVDAASRVQNRKAKARLS